MRLGGHRVGDRVDHHPAAASNSQPSPAEISHSITGRTPSPLLPIPPNWCHLASIPSFHPFPRRDRPTRPLPLGFSTFTPLHQWRLPHLSTLCLLQPAVSTQHSFGNGLKGGRGERWLFCANFGQEWKENK